MTTSHCTSTVGTFLSGQSMIKFIVFIEQGHKARILFFDGILNLGILEHSTPVSNDKVYQNNTGSDHLT